MSEQTPSPDLSSSQSSPSPTTPTTPPPSPPATSHRVRYTPPPPDNITFFSLPTIISIVPAFLLALHIFAYPSTALRPADSPLSTAQYQAATVLIFIFPALVTFFTSLALKFKTYRALYYSIFANSGLYLLFFCIIFHLNKIDFSNIRYSLLTTAFYSICSALLGHALFALVALINSALSKLFPYDITYENASSASANTSAPSKTQTSQPSP